MTANTSEGATRLHPNVEERAPQQAQHTRSLRHHQSVTLTLLFLAGVVNFFDRSSLSIANTVVRADMHLSATQMGWLLSAFSLAYGLAQLPLIGLLDHAGTRAVLGGGLILWSLAQGLTGFVRTFGQFLSFRVFLGTGEAPFYPSLIRSTREWFSPSTRARATGLMSSSQMIALSIAPPILTYIMLRLGWRSMFIVLGASGLLVAVAWILFHRSRQHTSFAEMEEHHASPAGAWKVLIRNRTVWGMMLGWGGINYTAWLYIAWLPGYLEAAHHLSVARSGWMAAIPFLGGAAGMLSSGVVSDFFANSGTPLTTVHRRNAIVGMVLSAFSTVVVAESRSVGAAVAGVAMALFFIHFGGTSGLGYVQAVSPLRYVASLGALQNFASFMIASAAPVVTGWFLDRTHSFTISLMICAGITLLGALSYATLAAPTPLEERHSALTTGSR